jgi:hypothetical protein
MTDRKGMLFSSFFLVTTASIHECLWGLTILKLVCVRESHWHTETQIQRHGESEIEGREGKVLFFSCEIFLWFFKSGISLMKYSLLQFKILPLGFCLLKISSVFSSSYESFLCFPERMPILSWNTLYAQMHGFSLIKSLMVLFSYNSMCSFVFWNFFWMFFFSYWKLMFFENDILLWNALNSWVWICKIATISCC